MKTLNLVQGSSEWLTHRRTHFNASDAPAMMGCSPYKTRTQLLHELKTGLAPEVDAGTQRRFDEGHRIEALARPLAEAIIGEELYPVTGSEGELSASFDGLTMGENISGEHKSLNDGIRASLPHAGRDSHTRNDGAMLGKLYRVQMEQQLMVSGAERALFSATRWEGDELVEERHCWYEPDMALRAEIIAGWKQFAIDLAAYVPAPMTVEPVGKAPETLPALHIEVTGMVTASNLDAFKTNALAVFGGINLELKTDSDFADAESTVRWCADVEDRLAAAKQHALSQTESIDALFRTIDDISAEARRVRLELNRLVKVRKEELRGEIVAAGIAALREHIAALNTRLGKSYMPAIAADFAGAIKGKRTVDSLRDAVSTTLANSKIEASATADKIQRNMATIDELAKDRAFLFINAAQIVLKEPEDLTMLVKSRIAEHQAAEAERQRIVETPKEPAPEVKGFFGSVSVPLPMAAAPVANVVPMRHAQLAAAPATPPTLTLGAIGTRLGFNLTADFLKNLGFEATKVKASCLFHEADFPLICMRLVAHVQGVQSKQAA